MVESEAVLSATASLATPSEQGEKTTRDRMRGLREGWPPHRRSEGSRAWAGSGCVPHAVDIPLAQSLGDDVSRYSAAAARHEFRHASSAIWEDLLMTMRLHDAVRFTALVGLIGAVLSCTDSTSPPPR